MGGRGVGSSSGLKMVETFRVCGKCERICKLGDSSDLYVGIAAKSIMKHNLISERRTKRKDKT